MQVHVKHHQGDLFGAQLSHTSFLLKTPADLLSVLCRSAAGLSERGAIVRTSVQQKIT